MNKQDEEKARELAGFQESVNPIPTQRFVFDKCVEMAAWKEEQMIEKVVEFIKQNFYSEGHGFPLYYSRFLYTPDDIIRDIKEVLTK